MGSSVTCDVALSTNIDTVTHAACSLASVWKPPIDLLFCCCGTATTMPAPGLRISFVSSPRGLLPIVIKTAFAVSPYHIRCRIVSSLQHPFLIPVLCCLPWASVRARPRIWPEFVCRSETKVCSSQTMSEKPEGGQDDVVEVHRRPGRHSARSRLSK